MSTTNQENNSINKDNNFSDLNNVNILNEERKNYSMTNNTASNINDNKTNNIDNNNNNNKNFSKMTNESKENLYYNNNNYSNENNKFSDLSNNYNYYFSYIKEKQENYIYNKISSKQEVINTSQSINKNMNDSDPNNTKNNNNFNNKHSNNISNIHDNTYYNNTNSMLQNYLSNNNNFEDNLIYKNNNVNQQNQNTNNENILLTDENFILKHTKNKNIFNYYIYSINYSDNKMNLRKKLISHCHNVNFFFLISAGFCYFLSKTYITQKVKYSIFKSKLFILTICGSYIVNSIILKQIEFNIAKSSFLISYKNKTDEFIKNDIERIKEIKKSRPIFK